MMGKKAMAAFVAERDAMLLSLDIERAKDFHRKYSANMEMPPDDIVEIGIHKARTAATNLPEEARQLSRRWLDQRGYSSLI